MSLPPLVESGLDPDGATEVAAQRASRPAKTILADDAVRAVQVEDEREAVGKQVTGHPLVDGGGVKLLRKRLTHLF